MFHSRSAISLKHTLFFFLAETLNSSCSFIAGYWCRWAWRSRDCKCFWEQNTWKSPKRCFYLSVKLILQENWCCKVYNSSVESYLQSGLGVSDRYPCLQNCSRLYIYLQSGHSPLKIYFNEVRREINGLLSVTGEASEPSFARRSVLLKMIWFILQLKTLSCNPLISSGIDRSWQ